MDKKNKQIIIFLGVVFAFFLNASFVFATEVKYPTILGMGLDSNSTLPEYAKYFYNIGIGLAGLLAVVVVAYGGIHWLVSFGRGKFTDEGKEWLKAGLLGLLLTISSYLIVFTINPDLVIFKLGELSPLSFLTGDSSSSSDSLPIITFNEIPAGIITENLLSRQMDCYNFDGNGDPIDGEKIKTDDGKTITGPTYLSHDRVDCSLKIAEAINKQAQTIRNLSDQITELMKQCSCGGTFTFTGANTTTSGASGTSSSSTCVNKTCAKNGTDCKWLGGKCDEGTLDLVGTTGPCKDTCSNKGCAPQGTNSQCCPTDVKQKIEHGAIPMSDCNNVSKDFKGLDEFRSQFNDSYEAIKAKVEITPAPKVNGIELSIINNGNCQVCADTCQACTNPKDKTCQKNLGTCQSNLAKCKKNYQTCLKKNSPWYNLRLADKLIYLKGRMESIKTKVGQDLTQLKTAESSLSGCYLSDTYIDFLKTYQQNNNKEKTILIKKTFSDQQTQEKIKPAKYCLGFEYNNSSCYSQCQKICPGTSASDSECYEKCPKCDSKDTKCLANQAVCVKKCYDSRSCLQNADGFKTFQSCFTGCRKKCLNSCDNLCNAEEKTKCQNNCNNNSQCILSNEDKCLMNFNQLKSCTDTSECKKQCNGDEDCIKSCMENCADSSALCKYCSDQYAGYPDCVEKTYAKNYSSSLIFKNSSWQKCPSAYEPPPTTSSCYTKSASASLTPCDCGAGKPKSFDCCKTDCITMCPETSKCPASSKCPLCPCDTINDLGESVTNGTGAGNGTTNGEGEEMQTCPDGTQSFDCTFHQVSYNIKNFFSKIFGLNNFAKAAENNTASAYRVCSATCENYAYNDDPLTFYCQNSWWEKDEAFNEKPIGENMIAPEKREIPIGQTIDDSEKWAKDFMDNIDGFTKKTQDMIQYIKDISTEKNYCQCDSKCDSAGKEPACKAECIFSELDSPDPATGNPYTCSCSRGQCNGNPCQKMINLLQGKTAKQNCPKGVEFKGMAYYQEQIDKALVDFKTFVAGQSRSDAVKELNYSRKATSECSVIQNNYNKETRILNCTRILDEQISPYVDKSNKIIINNKTINSYCYGVDAGKVLEISEPLADNWYCIETRQTSDQNNK